MNFLKRFGQDGKAGSPGRQSSPGKSTGSPGGSPRNGTGDSPNGPSGAGVPAAPRAYLAATPTSGTDPETCLEVFRSHWLQAVTLMNKVNMAPAGGGAAGGGGGSARGSRSGQEEIEAVRQHIDHLMLLLVEEAGEGSDHHGQEAYQGPILQYMLAEDVLEKILTWSSRCADHQDKLRLQQLKYYDLLISQARQALLIHKPVIRPLLKLLSACAEHANKNVEKQVILLLHQLCVCVTQDSRLLELLYNASSDHGPAKFLMFSLLIPYVHKEGSIGQQARDALLLIMALSSKHDHIGRYIADNSDFCPVLATGLSALYSSLPRKLTITADDWYRITEEDVNSNPDLVHFLNSLEFCNAVVQVAHPLVKEQLLTFIYNGFLVPVIAPALHQNQDYILKRSTMDILKLPISLVESYFANSMEEVIAATAYLELFIRRVTEAALMETFLRFISTERHDDTPILESLISRVGANTRLCMVSLSLFWTLIDLNCEDVMFQLVFKHLIPCTHVMVSQRRSVRDVDLYSKAAEKFLSLTPACCVPDASDTPPDGATTPINAETVSLTSSRSSSPDVSPSIPAGLLGTKLEHYETNYMEYLDSAHGKVHACTGACACWCYPYDGDSPTQDILALQSPGGATTASTSTPSDSVASTPVVTPAIEIKPFLPPPPSEGDATPTNDVMADSPLVGNTGTTAAVDPIEGRKPEKLSKDVSVDKDTEEDSGKGGEGSGEDNVDELPVIRDTSAPSSGGNTSGAKISHVKQDSSADSVISEADSALSGSSSCYTEKPEPSGSPEPAGSRSDSPLNDDFDAQDFNAFLLSLKRVKTPVEFCDNIEDSIQEFEELLNSLKLNVSRTNPTVGLDTKVKEPGSSNAEDLPKFVNTCSSPDGKELVKPSAAAEQNHTDSEAVKTHPGGVVELTEFDKEINKRVSASLEAAATPGASVASIPSTPTLPSATQHKPSLHTPLKYSSGAPNIGLFLSTLLSKLETMMQNTLYVNLLLTAVITRLACYPQPLLRSFLLNHSLVFQPTVKSLIQVLGSVKHKVDCYSYTVKDFESLMLKARRFLAWREEIYFGDQESAAGAGGHRDSVVSLPPNVKTHKETGRKRSPSVFETFFTRNKPTTKGRGIQDGRRIQVMQDNKGIRYINRQASPDHNATQEKMESVKTKNAVYCALVLEEFLKELAALSQEHAVLAADATSDHVPLIS